MIFFYFNLSEKFYFNQPKDNLSIYLYTYKTLITLIVCLFEAVHTNPGYGMATLIYNNLLDLILATVILLRSSS